MSRLTGNDAKSLIEAYNAVYAPQQEEQVIEEISEECLNEAPIRYSTGPTAADLQRQRAQTSAKAAPTPSRPIRYSTGPTAADLQRQRASAPSLAKTPPAALTRDQQMLKNLGPAQYAAFKGGGGFAALQKAGGTSDRAALGRVVAQGRQNIGRFDTKPAPAPSGGAKAAPPQRVVGDGSAAGKPSAASPAPTAKPAPPQRVVGDGSAAGKPSAAAPTRTFNPLMQRTFGYQTGNSPSEIAAASKGVSQATSDAAFKRSREMRQKLQSTGTLTQSFDIFDTIKGYLLDEGYADTEEAAIAIMANMGQEWKQQILDGGKKG